jgi:hypothetical protein
MATAGKKQNRHCSEHTIASELTRDGVTWHFGTPFECDSTLVLFADIALSFLVTH